MLQSTFQEVREYAGRLNIKRDAWRKRQQLQNKLLIINGARQVGKTSLLRLRIVQGAELFYQNLTG